MFESKAGILWIGGIGFFAFAFLSNGIVPMLLYKDLKEQTAEEVVNELVMYQFRDLQRRYPKPFEEHFGIKQQAQPAEEEATDEEYAEACVKALRLGRQLYIGEGCWHCHSQFVRPVSNESKRWGQVAKTEEYQNELQRPVMFGTRRIGPDLSREGGRRSNDWHVVHFYRPKTTSPDSPMPAYPWFFDETSGQTEATADGVVKITTSGTQSYADGSEMTVSGELSIVDPEDEESVLANYPLPGNDVTYAVKTGDTVKQGDLLFTWKSYQPNKRGLALITYVQWLGTWLDTYPYYEELEELRRSEDF